MSLVATLVSSPADPQVTDGLIASVSRRLGGDAHKVLADGIAADIAVGDYLSQNEAIHRIAEVVGETAVDFAVLPLEGRRKKLLVADMDSTMIGQECIDELAAFVGLKEHVAAITERAMQGELDFEAALDARVAALGGLGAERRLVVILGGDGKGQDFSPLAEPIAQTARAVVLIGRDAPLLRQALQGSGVPLLDAADMPHAVTLAAQHAQAGDAVLMSPACASLDMFRDYAHRAQVFTEEVQALAEAGGQVLEVGS